MGFNNKGGGVTSDQSSAKDGAARAIPALRSRDAGSADKTRCSNGGGGGGVKGDASDRESFCEGTF